jgi:hypothetical protein
VTSTGVRLRGVQAAAETAVYAVPYDLLARLEAELSAGAGVRSVRAPSRRSSSLPGRSRRYRIGPGQKLGPTEWASIAAIVAANTLSLPVRRG